MVRDWQVVYVAPANGFCEIVVQRLRNAGIKARALDRPNHWNEYAARGTPQVRIGVPPHLAASAQRVIAAWEAEDQEVVRPLARTVHRELMAWFVIPVVVVLSAAWVLQGTLSGRWAPGAAMLVVFPTVMLSGTIKWTLSEFRKDRARRAEPRRRPGKGKRRVRK